MRLWTVAAAALVALVAVPATAADAPIKQDPPTLTVKDMTVEATGPDGAVVAYEITADSENGPPIVVCSPKDGSRFPLGATQVTCTAVDPKTQKSTTKSFVVRVQDTTPPTVSVPSGSIAEATGPAGAAVTYSGVSARDVVSGDLTPSCKPSSGSMFPLGATTVSCTAMDRSGNTGSASFTINVVDTTPPVVRVPGDIAVEATGRGGAAVTYSVSASDTVSGALTPSCDRPSGSTFPVGRTTVTCTATDGSGNRGRASFTVTVKDSKPPRITVPSGVTAEATGPSGAAVPFTVTADDDVSGTLTPSCKPSSGSTFPLGATTVSCTATDGGGNTASASFTVTVKDTKPPTISVPSSPSAEATGPSGAAVSYTVSATDTVSGSITVNCDRPSGSTFPLGSTTVTCKAADSSGNSASATFTVQVKDTTPPSFRSVPSDISAEANGPGGSSVRYDAPTAVDLVDGAVAASCSPASGATFALGSTTVTCRATDSRGNAGTASFSVRVVDTAAPVLTPPAPLTVSSAGADSLPATNAAIAAFLNGASARDIVDGSVSVSHDAPGTFPVGVTTVTFTAQDRSGNTATAKSTVTVKREAVPPAKPLDRVPPDDVRGLSAKGGDRSITLRWQKPRADDFDHVVVTRSTRGSPEKPVYTGQAFKYVDRGLVNGVDYRYVVVSYDHAGNRAAGVAIVAAPSVQMLISPADGARVKEPPLLRWRPVAEAGYYNVQLFRGRTKMLTAWPVRTQFQLTASWPYGGHRERLAPGLYRWYVFPGFGPRSAAKYGPALGPSTFTLVRRG